MLAQTYSLDLNTIVSSANLAEQLSDEQCKDIAAHCYAGYSQDRMDRSQWDMKMAAALELAMQVAHEKTFPWAKASNVKFPIITIAAINYNARAYPALIPGNQVVKCSTPAEDEQGQQRVLADKISRHMSYQILSRDDGWEESMDRVLIVQAILGCAFKKVRFNYSKQRIESRLVLPQYLLIPYYAKTLEDATRLTEIMFLSRNEMETRVRSGMFCDYGEGQPAAFTPFSQEQVERDSKGVAPSGVASDNPYVVLEQHCWLDLDGDGYEEPYIVSLREDNRTLLRVVARFTPRDVDVNQEGQVICIRPTNHYIKYSFIPSPDGSIYDLGFGHLLGPTNEAINTALNQIIDSGTVKNTAGGFLGRGVKFRSGDNAFRPFEWKRVEGTGDDIRKSIMPLPVGEPSAVLYDVLKLLVDYSERVGMATEPMVGKNPGQNTPAETSRNTLAEGQRVLNAIYKRTYRSLRAEIRQWAWLCAIYMGEKPNDFLGSMFGVNRFHYESLDQLAIEPEADPAMVSDADKLQRANMLMQVSTTNPGYNRYEVNLSFLRAIGIPNIDKIMPDPKGPNAVPPPPNPKMELEQLKIKAKKEEHMLQLRFEATKALEEAAMNRAAVDKLKAETAAILADISRKDRELDLKRLNDQIQALESKNSVSIQYASLINELLKGMNDAENQPGGVPGMANSPGNKGVPQLPSPQSEGATGASGGAATGPR